LYGKNAHIDFLFIFQNFSLDRPDEGSARRTLEDLRMYEQFFPEVLDIEVR